MAEEINELEEQLEQQLEEQTGEQQEQGGGIRIDFDVLDHRGETTTSLSDLYGFPVFSEMFLRQIEQYQRRQKREQEQSFQQVFFGEPIEDLEPYFLAVLQAEPEQIIQADFDVEIDTQSPLVMVGFIALGMAAAGMVFILIERMKRRKKR